MTDFTGFEIVPNPFLEGMKIGIKCGNRITVSPAFWSLCKSATPTELEALLRSYKLLELPENPPFVVMP